MIPNKKKSGKVRQRKRTTKGGGKIGRDVGLYGRNALAPVSVRGLKSIGFPAVSRTSHRYIQSNVSTAATGSLAQYQFRANSLFDPDLTGTGHQPYGFDQWKTYYATYMVTSSRITVECIVITSPTLAGVFTSSEVSTGLTTADTFCEPGRGQAGIVSPVFGAARTFEAKWNLSDIPNHDPADYSALVSANPTNSDFFTVYHQDAFALAASPVLYFTVLIEYNVTWKDPVTFASS